MNVPRLGRVQLMIMRVLWDNGRANAREITEALNHLEPIAHSTVQTLLRKLEAKGAIGHEVENRTFVFRPLVGEDRVKRNATHDLLDRIFGGSVADLVSHLLQHERVPAAELNRIRKLLDAQKGKEG
jgi:BlaI family penicillinase repressor